MSRFILFNSKFKTILAGKKDIIAVLLLLAILSGIAVASGSISSGFRFKDDFVFFPMHDQIEKEGFAKVCLERIKGATASRFYPVHIAHRVSMVGMFKLSSEKFYISTTIMLVMCALFLFCFARSIGFSPVAAFFFPLLTLLGQQAACWWRLGTCEPIGMFFLALALLFMGIDVRLGKKWFVESLFVACMILSSLCKETIIILIPAILFGKIWINSYRLQISFLKAIKKNMFSIVVLLVVMAAELFIIFFIVGADHESLGGIKLPSANTLRNILPLLINFKMGVLVMIDVYAVMVGFVGCFFLIQPELDGKERVKFVETLKVFIDKFGKIVLLSLMVIVPQFVAYSKAGIFNRFWLPAYLGISIFLAYVLDQIVRSRAVGRFTRMVFIVLLSLLLLIKLGHTLYRTNYLADEAKACNKVVETVIGNTLKDTRVLVVSDPATQAEWNWALEYNLRWNDRRGDFVAMPLDLGVVFHTVELSERLRTGHKKRYDLLEDLQGEGVPNDYRCIVLFPGSEQQFLQKSVQWFNDNKYRKKIYKYGGGEFIVFVEKGQTDN